MERDDHDTLEQTSTPRPDPTERTKQELLREITHLRELLEAKLDGHTKFADGRHAETTALIHQKIEALDRQFELHLGEARHQLQDQIDAQERATAAELVAATKATEVALASATKAIDKAEEATEKRFDGVNAFRQQLTDQSRTFLRVDMFDQHVREAREAQQLMQSRIDTNSNQLLTISSSETGGKDRDAQQRANIATVLGVVAMLLAVATFVMALTA